MQPTDKQLLRRARMQERGRSHFIWVYGVLIWGLTTGLLWGLLMSWSHGIQELPSLLTVGLIVFPIGGYFFGAVLWKALNAIHKRSRLWSEKN